MSTSLRNSTFPLVLLLCLELSILCVHWYQPDVNEASGQFLHARTTLVLSQELSSHRSAIELTKPQKLSLSMQNPFVLLPVAGEAPSVQQQRWKKQELQKTILAPRFHCITVQALPA